MSLPEESLKDVKCGTCRHYLSFFPILIAKDKVAICGRCSEVLADDGNYIRDIPFESLAQHIRFPCIYHAEGCVEHLLPADVPSHEKNCAYRVIHCSLDCMWQGTVNDLQSHFEELHPNSIMRNGEFEIDFLNSYELYNLVIFNDELFCFKRKFDQSETILECSLLCYKLVDPITKYQYSIKVENGARNLEDKFSPKSAENFQRENVTEVGVERVKNKLGDPSTIIGTVTIFTDEEKVQEKPKTVNTEINYEMLRELECPVCLDYIIPPIFQCVTGHSICGDCKAKVSQCPTCNSEIKNTQNFTLEKMAYFMTYPCKFSEYGCDFSSRPAQIKPHQKHCLHGPHLCPLREYENCNWKSSAKEIFPHVLSKHHDNILEIDTVSVFIDGNYYGLEDTTCYILKYSNALFKLHYFYKENTFNWAMQLVGPPEDARKYKFEIDVVDNSSCNQRLFMRNFCAPFNDKEHSFETPGSFVFVKSGQIKSFITDILTYRIRILS